MPRDKIYNEFPNNPTRVKKALDELLLGPYVEIGTDGDLHITQKGKEAVKIMKRNPYEDAEKNLEKVRESLHRENL